MSSHVEATYKGFKLKKVETDEGVLVWKVIGTFSDQEAPKELQGDFIYLGELSQVIDTYCDNERKMSNE